jgi:hypothetical protein
VIITTPWPQFKTLDDAVLEREVGERVTVIDPWRIVDPTALSSAATIVWLGYGAEAGNDAGILPMRRARG